MTYFDINLDLTSEDKLIRQEAYKFAMEVLRPAGIAIDSMSAEDAISPRSPLWEVLDLAFGLGYHKVAFPKEVGGIGCTPLQTHIITEELFYGSLGLAGIIFLSGFPFAEILFSGNQELIEKFVIPFCNTSKANMIGCWALTESEYGSDMMAIGEPIFSDHRVKGQVSAILDGDEYVISGAKSAWVSCAPIATHCMLNVHIDDSKGLSGGGVCIVPLDRKGVRRAKPLEKVGQRELPQGELFFDNVRIPKSWMFIEPEAYPDSILNNLGFGNAALGVISLALARAAFDDTFAYTKKRIQGGKPLIEHYTMKIRLHRIFSKLEAMRAMTRAVWDLNARVYPPVGEYALAVKTYCTETAKAVIDECIQVWGANGLTKEYNIEKYWRDSGALTIEDGENYNLNRLGGHILKDVYPRKTVNRIL